MTVSLKHAADVRRSTLFVDKISDCVVNLRYEDEEAVDVCEAMERMAQLFLSDSGKVEDVTDQEKAATNPA